MYLLTILLLTNFQLNYLKIDILLKTQILVLLYLLICDQRKDIHRLGDRYSTYDK